MRRIETWETVPKNGSRVGPVPSPGWFSKRPLLALLLPLLLLLLLCPGPSMVMGKSKRKVRFVKLCESGVRVP